MADINEVNGVFGGVEFGTGSTGNGGSTGTGFSGNSGVNGAGLTGSGIGFTGNETELGGFQYPGTGVSYNGNVVTDEKKLPVKTGFWNKFKAVMFREIPWNYEIKVVLTPYQQKVEDEINEFLHQEITWEKVHDFLFQEISFGKKKRA